MTRTPAEPLADGEMIENLCRPIIGIDNRTALEAFDIMADRIRRCLAAYNTNDRLREALFNLTIAAGELAVATDGEVRLRPKRQAVLDAMKVAEVVLTPIS